MCDDDKVNRDEESREVLELVSNSSLVDLEEFLSNEKSCLHLDENQLFSEINRLASLNESKYESEDEDRTIEELLKEAETLINQPIGENPAQLTSISCESTPLEIRHNLLDRYDYSTVMNTNNSCSQNDVSLSRVYKLNFFFFIVYFSSPTNSVRNHTHKRYHLISRLSNLARWQQKTVPTSVSHLHRI